MRLWDGEAGGVGGLILCGNGRSCAEAVLPFIEFFAG